MKHLAVVVLFVALVACSKKKTEDTGAASGSAPVAGSATAGSGEGSGSAAGSATAGSGSAAGSGEGSGSAAGSGDGSGSATGSGDGSGSAAAGSGSAAAGEDEKSAFDKMTGEQKADFMKKKVVPPMKKAFQKFDAKKFANFGCKTCHGKDPKKTKYKMPNPELPKLDFAKLKAGEDKEIAEFMAKVVKSDMAKILEEKEMDPAHPELGGFGCLDCHEMKK